MFVNGINPLRIYIYKDGLARFATRKFKKAAENNLDNLFMHLTNYAINKESEHYIHTTTNKDGTHHGSKRAYKDVLKIVEQEHGIPACEEL